MEKKLTKAQVKEMEQKQYELRRLRKDTIEAVKSYYKDVESTIRYYKINSLNDKLDYGKLTLDETLKIMRHYKEMDFLKAHAQYTKEDKDKGYDRDWWFISLMITTDEERDCWGECRLNDILKEDDLWNDEIIWNDVQLKRYLKLAKKYGYKRIFYTNASSGALANITSFIDLGAKVIGTCSKKGYDKAGLIFDIEDVIIDEEEE